VTSPPKLPFSISAMPRSRVSDLLRIREQINTAPPYQRQSDVWEPRKRQLFIDSLLNGFDIPKMYFHEVSGQKGAGTYQYAVVDGKQRLETIWAYLDDKFELADDFLWYEDQETTNVGGLKYSQLPPKMQARLDSTSLPVQVIYTEDAQWIEELFSRLNEAVALNAPERRNAMGGPLPQIIRTLPARPFFQDRLPFGDNRYKHYDLATKFLYLEFRGGPSDTKRKDLDDFVKDFRERKATKEAKALEAKTIAVLGRLEDMFGESDVLLKSLGLVVTYYLLEREKTLSGTKDAREWLLEFDELRRQIRALMGVGASGGVTRVKLDPELVEFERLSQSPNDVAAMTNRMKTIARFITDPKLIRAKSRAMKG
jgi:hypothetical protein